MSDRDARASAAPPLVTAAAVSYAANTAFGTAVAAGLIDNGRIRWVHQALFVATSLLTTAALAACAAERRRAGLALLPVAGPLAALPYAGGGLRRRVVLAASAAPAFGAALVLVRRSH